MSTFKFGLTCLKDGETMKGVSGNIDDGFILQCPKCKTEVCLTIEFPFPMSIEQEINRKEEVRPAKAVSGKVEK